MMVKEPRWQIMCLVLALVCFGTQAFVIDSRYAATPRSGLILPRRCPEIPRFPQKPESPHHDVKDHKRTALEVLTPSASFVLAASSGIIVFHELGHYLAARMFKIKVEEFSVGVGPKLIGFRALGNRFSLRLFLIGGYVKFPSVKDKEEAVQNKAHHDESMFLRNRPWHERAIVTSAGVVFNLLLSYVLFLRVLVKLGYLTKFSFPQAAQVAAIGIFRMTKSITATYYGLMCSFVTWLLPFVNKKAFTGQFIVPVLQNRGFCSASAMLYACYMSLTMAVFNALPIPSLDGGRMVFLFFEAITKRKVNETVEWVLTMMTYLLLLGYCFFP